MRLHPTFIWVCTYIVLCVYAAEADLTAVVRRQDAETSISPTRSNTFIEPSSSLSSNDASGTQDATNSESAELPADSSDTISSSSATRSAPTVTTATPSITSAINGPLQTASNSTAYSDEGQPDALPLPPKITPALAVAGVLLILAGITYTLIGIKSRWLQIFLSSAFLTSLSVTVLLIYVMNPPVRPAVQGAYLVAVVMTGIVFGAGSLVFKEVTEGLGCLLGGFCLSMWLLSLRPGGTVQSTEGKVILIAVFTVVAYALSFSHYTRPYGLIGATSFAGATAAVLGFDCFSRAGLKEFWLYIWNLNDNLFPLNTHTYPITRGIRVELAVIVLICFLGVISQLKLWKVIKDRREKKDATRSKEESERNRVEEAIGRRLEEGNERERAQWEAVYGDQDDFKGDAHANSGLGTEENNSLRKVSVSVMEIEGENSAGILELKEVSGLSNQHLNREQADAGPGQAAMTIRPVTKHVAGSRPDIHEDAPSNTELAPASIQPAADASPDVTAITRQGTMAASPALFPPIIPLPFTIPTVQAPERSTDGSVCTIAESEPGFGGYSGGQSGRARLQRISSGKEHVDSVCQPDDNFMIFYATHSKASSLAATFDDDLDDFDAVEDTRAAPSPESKSATESYCVPEAASLSDVQTLQPEEGVKASHSPKHSQPQPPLSTMDDSDPEEFQRPVKLGPKPKPAQFAASLMHDMDGFDAPTRSSRARPSAPGSPTESSQAQDTNRRTKRRLSAGAVSSTGSLTKGALDRVPSQLSHVVMSYRTNEWAKHISTANEPEFDEPEVVPVGQDEELPTQLAERYAPVNVEVLQQSATKAANPLSIAGQPNSTVLSAPLTDLNQTFPSASNTSSSDMLSGRASQDSSTQPDILQVTSSQLRQGKNSAVDLVRSTPATAQPSLLATRGLRSSSTPVLGQTLRTPPIDENAEFEFRSPARRSISPLPVAGSTLLAKRDSFIRNKHYQLTAKGATSPTEMIYSQPPMRSTSRLSLIEEAGPRAASQLSNFDEREIKLPLRSASRLSLPSVNEEDMTLSQRKAIIQQQQTALLAETRLATGTFDAHLPQQSSSGVSAQKRESMLASWRESMRQEAAMSSVPKETVETRRADMLMEKHHSRMSQQYSEATKIYQENAFDQAMRRGDMQELHKEAMRKMQANANKHVS